ncbi:MAG: sel1 repeat family protein [Elusimicrobiales bacterium]|nr:sel1 repeat family protein [Elusimicrobiales bacterium]
MGFYDYFKKKFSSSGSDEKITFLAEIFSDSIISSNDKTMKSIRGWRYEMLNPTLCPIYVLLFDCWTFVHAMETLKPMHWSEILNKMHLNIWEKNSQTITQEDFVELAQKLYPKLESALALGLSHEIMIEGIEHKCSATPQIGELMSGICFGKEHIGIDTVLHFEQMALLQIDLSTKLIKDIADINGFSDLTSDGIQAFKKAAEQDLSEAQHNVGNMYKDGQGVAQDDKEAMKWYTKAEEQGDAYAQFNLGNIYKKGQGVTQDYKEAVKWLKKAAEQGDSQAEHNLGNMYKDGRGVDQDYKEAVKWYTKAAEQGDAQAQFILGLMYGGGRGVAQDYVKAYKWTNLAASQDNEYAKGREIVESKMTKEQITEAQKLASEFIPKKEKE